MFNLQNRKIRQLIISTIKLWCKFILQIEFKVIKLDFKILWFFVVKKQLPWGLQCFAYSSSFISPMRMLNHLHAMVDSHHFVSKSDVVQCWMELSSRWRRSVNQSQVWKKTFPSNLILLTTELFLHFVFKFHSFIVHSQTQLALLSEIQYFHDKIFCFNSLKLYIIFLSYIQNCVWYCNVIEQKKLFFPFVFAYRFSVFFSFISFFPPVDSHTVNWFFFSLFVSML